MAVLEEAERKGHQALTGVDRLGLRITTMMTAPQAQLDRRLTIHRLDTDEDYAWATIMELIKEEEGIEMFTNEDGSVTVAWEKQSADDWVPEQMEEIQVIAERE